MTRSGISTAFVHAARAVLFPVLGMLWLSPAQAQSPAAINPLTGTWELVAADVVAADGQRSHDYGESPKGQLQVDASGRYSLQIFNAQRPRFASGDRARGTPEEYAQTVLGTSTHFGTLTVDTAAGLITFNIEKASFPNRDGTQANCKFVLKGDVLSYMVPARPDGSIPVSVWHRL